MDASSILENDTENPSRSLSSSMTEVSVEIEKSNLDDSKESVIVLIDESAEKPETNNAQEKIKENLTAESMCETKIDVENSIKDTTKKNEQEKKEEKKEETFPTKLLRNSMKIEAKILSPMDSKVKSKEEFQEDTPKDNKDRKRRYRSLSTTPSKSLTEDGVVRSKRKRLQTSDKFCWRCHKENVEAQCSACPRSWHRKCIGGIPPESMENWVCGECAAILKAENVETRSVIMAHVTVDQLCMMLKHVVERMREYPGSEPFWKAVDTNEVSNYLDYVVKPMDLGLLETNVRAKLYGSTDAFMADAKWIQHNCIVFNTCGGVYTDTLKLTNAAKQIIKVARQEVSEMEACPDCYAHGRNLPRPVPTWFIEPCRRPHVLVWAKLKGFPFWPAKAMPRQNSQGYVDVRFFGQHDRAWVSPKDMYLYSKEPPTQFPRKRKQDMDECVKEIERHCQKLATVFGDFTFAPGKALYNPQDPMQIKLLLPQYDPLQPSSYLTKLQSSASSKKRPLLNRRSTPVKRKSIDESVGESFATPDAKVNSKNRLSSNGNHVEHVDALPFKEIVNTTMKDNNFLFNKTTDVSPAKKKNGLFGQKSSAVTNEKVNHQVKKLSAILPSRISKRRSSTNKNDASNKSKPVRTVTEALEIEKKREKTLNDVSMPSSRRSSSNSINNSTLNKSSSLTPVTINKTASLLVNKQKKTPEVATKCQESAKSVIQSGASSVINRSEQQPVTYFVLVNNDVAEMDKKISYLKSSNRTVTTTTITTTSTTTMPSVTPTTMTATTVAPPVIKQEPRTMQLRLSQTPSPTPAKKESKARKTFVNKPPNFPQEQSAAKNYGVFSRSPMVYIPNYQSESRNGSYELPPPETGPFSAQLNKNAQELVKRMAQLMEETLSNVAQNNNTHTQDNRALIHSLELKIERIKWQHQQQLAEMEHNYDRKIKETRASLEAEQQRILEEALKQAEDKRLKSIEETKRKQWCAMCGREAMFYCCWNTAYCDYPCQQVHWPAHMDKCTQKPTYRIATSTPQQLMPKLVVSTQKVMPTT